MKSEKMIYRHGQIIDNLRKLPRKMLQIHGLDNATEFVLHELCSKNCFDIPRAAYFIDNPDFNHLKGVVGVSGIELANIVNIWENPDLFTQHMMQSPFNQKVRSFACESRKRRGQSEQDLAKNIADELGLKDYGFYSWDMKHDNHGFLVCETNKMDVIDHLQDDVMVDGLSLLSFCPVH